MLVPSVFLAFSNVTYLLYKGMLRPKNAVQSEPEATVYSKVTMENSRALWRAAAGFPHRVDPDIATPAAVSNQSSARTLTAAKKCS